MIARALCKNVFSLPLAVFLPPPPPPPNFCVTMGRPAIREQFVNEIFPIY